MNTIIREFAEAQRKSVDNGLPVGGWRVHLGYELWEHYEDGDSNFYVEVNPNHARDPKRVEPESSEEWVYAPLHEPTLFIEFSELFDGRTSYEGAGPTVLDWVGRHGTLGVHDGYPTRDGGAVWGRFDDRESVVGFVKRSVRANRCLRLLAAIKAPNGPDTEKLQELGARGNTPEQVVREAERTVDEAIDMYLESETCMRRYRSRDGSTFRGPGFRSLLGALWLQMSNFRDAPEMDIRRCRWCGNPIAVEGGEPPPSDPLGGARGKHKTHANRQFCKKKNGVENKCKNDYNYDRRKSARAS